MGSDIREAPRDTESAKPNNFHARLLIVIVSILAVVIMLNESTADNELYSYGVSLRHKRERTTPFNTSTVNTLALKGHSVLPRRRSVNLLNSLGFLFGHPKGPCLQQIPRNIPPEKCRQPLNNSNWAFWINCMRGSFSATVENARMLKHIHGARISLFICVGNDSTAVSRIEHEFGCAVKTGPPVWEMGDLDNTLSSHNITHLYMHKAPAKDNICLQSRLPQVCNIAHLMFNAEEPRGDVVARISRGIPVSKIPVPVLGLIVPKKERYGDNMRSKLGIPKSAVVFGRFGGPDTFDINWVHQIVCKEASDPTSSIYFIFANTKKFCEPTQRLIYLPNLLEAERSRFVRTTDAMLHGRGDGETFGIAVAEFSAHNRPVFTTRTGASAHIEILGKSGILYTKDSLRKQLRDFNKTDAALREWDAYGDYRPERVGKVLAAILHSPS